MKRMVDTVLEQFGRIDVLVNNAGILTQSHLADMPTEMWDEMIRTNLRSAFLCTRAVLPGMLAQGRRQNHLRRIPTWSEGCARSRSLLSGQSRADWDDARPCP